MTVTFPKSIVSAGSITDYSTIQLDYTMENIPDENSQMRFSPYACPFVRSRRRCLRATADCTYTYWKWQHSNGNKQFSCPAQHSDCYCERGIKNHSHHCSGLDPLLPHLRQATIESVQWWVCWRMASAALHWLRHTHQFHPIARKIDGGGGCEWQPGRVSWPSPVYLRKRHRARADEW